MLQPQTMTVIYPFQNIYMDNLSKRLLTFSNWPLRTQVWPVQLSNAGFFYSGEDTKVQCFSCGVITLVDTWQKGERPEFVHFLLNNDCAYIKEKYPSIKDEIKRDNLILCLTQSHALISIPEISASNMDQAENRRLYNRSLCNVVRNMEINNNNSNQPEDYCNTDDNNVSSREHFICGAVDIPMHNAPCPTNVIENTIYKADGTAKTVSSPYMTKEISHCLSQKNSSHLPCTSEGNCAVLNRISETQEGKLYKSNDTSEQVSLCKQTSRETEFRLQFSSLSNNNGRMRHGFRLPENDLYIISNNKETLKQNISVHNEVNVECNSSLKDMPTIDIIYDSQRTPNTATNILQRNISTDRTGIISAVLNQPVDVDQGADTSAYNGFQSSTYEPDFCYPDYRNLQKRLLSYRIRPSSAQQSPQALAESGCFYTGKDDVVRCFCCNLGLSEWTADDNPWIEHARHNPRCWFVRKVKGQEFIDNIQIEWKKRYRPRNPAFDGMSSRLLTFEGWRDDIEQTPDTLADAGFFYTGETDVVRCHYCDGGLRNWEQGDIPWEEHARWFPSCKYLIKMKGCRYIEHVKEKYELLLYSNNFSPFDFIYE